MSRSLQLCGSGSSHCKRWRRFKNLLVVGCLRGWTVAPDGRFPAKVRTVAPDNQTRPVVHATGRQRTFWVQPFFLRQPSQLRHLVEEVRAMGPTNTFNSTKFHVRVCKCGSWQRSGNFLPRKYFFSELTGRNTSRRTKVDRPTYVQLSLGMARVAAGLSDPSLSLAIR